MVEMKTFWKMLFCMAGLQLAAASPGDVHILAAENFYGDVAQTIGGANVSVTSVISSPNDNPHFFNAPANLADLVNQADIIIENGAGYDSWMDQLYAKSNHRALLINVAAITHTGSADNPHIWYNPQTMPAFARILAFQLSKRDPNNQSNYYQNVKAFLSMGQLYQVQVHKVTNRVAGMPVTATEPIANALLSALKLHNKNQGLQIDLMNNIPLSPEAVQKFAATLNSHEIKLLVYNNQVNNAITQQLQTTAKEAGIPVVGVQELMPANLHYYQWMYQELFAIRDALLNGTSSS